MGMKFSELKNHEPLQKVVVHSLEMALYQVSVIINNVEYYVTEEDGEFVRAVSPLHVQKRFEKNSVRTNDASPHKRSRRNVRAARKNF